MAGSNGNLGPFWIVGIVLVIIAGTSFFYFYKSQEREAYFNQVAFRALEEASRKFSNLEKRVLNVRKTNDSRIAESKTEIEEAETKIATLEQQLTDLRDQQEAEADESADALAANKLMAMGEVDYLRSEIKRYLDYATNAYALERTLTGEVRCGTPGLFGLVDLAEYCEAFRQASELSGAGLSNPLDLKSSLGELQVQIKSLSFNTEEAALVDRYDDLEMAHVSLFESDTVDGLAYPCEDECLSFDKGQWQASVGELADTLNGLDLLIARNTDVDAEGEPEIQCRTGSKICIEWLTIAKDLLQQNCAGVKDCRFFHEELRAAIIDNSQAIALIENETSVLEEVFEEIDILYGVRGSLGRYISELEGIVTDFATAVDDLGMAEGAIAGRALPQTADPQALPSKVRQLTEEIRERKIRVERMRQMSQEDGAFSFDHLLNQGFVLGGKSVAGCEVCLLPAPSTPYNHTNYVFAASINQQIVYVPLDEVLKAERSLFAMTLLVDKDGRVLARSAEDQELLGLNFINVSKFLLESQRPQAPGSFFFKPAKDVSQDKVSAEVHNVQSAFTEVVIGNARYRIYLYPVEPSRGLQVAVDDKATDPGTLYVMGVVPNQRLVQERLRISPIAGALLGVLVTIAILSFVFVKLSLVHPQAPFTMIDLSYSVLGLMLWVLLVFSTLATLVQYAANSKAAESLQPEHLRLTEGFKDELAELTTTAYGLLREESEVANVVINGNDPVGTVVLQKGCPENCVERAFYLDATLRSYQHANPIENIFVIGTEGSEGGKVQGNLVWGAYGLAKTPPRDLSKRVYYQQARRFAGAPYTIEWQGRSGEHKSIPVNLTFERIENLSDGRRTTQFAISPDLDEPWKNNVLSFGTTLRTFQPDNVRVDYAVVDRRGHVLFHSRDSHSLVENLVAEMEGNTHLRAVLAHQGELSPVAFSASYRGESVDVVAGTLHAGLPLTLVVFRTNDGQQMSFMFKLATSATQGLVLVLVLGALLLLVHVFWPKHLNVLWPLHDDAQKYREVSLAAMLLALLYLPALILLRTFIDQPPMLLIAAAVLSLWLALALVVVAGSHGLLGSLFRPIFNLVGQRRGNLRLAYVLMLLSLTVGAVGVPAIGLNVITSNEIDLASRQRDEHYPWLPEGNQNDSYLQTLCGSVFDREGKRCRTAYANWEPLADLPGNEAAPLTLIAPVASTPAVNDDLSRLVVEIKEHKRERSVGWFDFAIAETALVVLLVCSLMIGLLYFVFDFFACRLMGVTVPLGFHRRQLSLATEADWDEKVKPLIETPNWIYQRLAELTTTPGENVILIRPLARSLGFLLAWVAWTTGIAAIRHSARDIASDAALRKDVLSRLRRHVGSPRQILVVEGLETLAFEPEMREEILNFLEGLAVMPDVYVILVCNASPLYALTRQDAYVATQPGDGVCADQGEVMRWSGLLASFRKFYDWEPIDVTLTGGLKDSNNARAAVYREVAGFPDLVPMLEDALEVVERRDLTPDEVTQYFSAKAGPLYREKWNLCTRRERLLLYQIARRLIVNPRNQETLEHMLRRGFISRTPHWRLMNRSFQRFVLSAESETTFARWLNDADVSTWHTVRIPLMATIFVLGALLIWTTSESIEAFVSIAAGMLGLLPLVLRNLTMMRGSPAAGE